MGMYQQDVHVLIVFGHVTKNALVSRLEMREWYNRH
jgi:hypothetical protein